MRRTLSERAVVVGSLTPGPNDTIADVPGVRVGHRTRVRGTGALRTGVGPVRTGVSVVVPPGDGPWPAAVDVINGYGKSLGLMQVAELGELETPIFLTNTLAVGAVQQGYLRHVRDRYAARPGRSLNVVVTECNDGYLNDLWGLHVRTEDAVLALQDADRQGPVEQGSVGAGTGMVAFGHKGGIGSASRRLGDGETMVGALVLLNCGRAGDLRVVGRPAPEGTRPVPEPAPGSVIVVLATNGLWDRHDLRRGVRRAVHGLARTGAASDPGSGDVALLFRTATEAAPTKATPPLDQLFRAVAEVTEAAVLNALVTATTVVGRDGNVAHALPDEALG